MAKRGQSKLKVMFVTSPETNRAIEEFLLKRIAEIIYNSPEFRKLLAGENTTGWHEVR